MLLAAGLLSCLALLVGQLVSFMVQKHRQRKEDALWISKIRGSHPRFYV